MSQHTVSRGRPPVDPARWNQAVDLLGQGKTVKDVVEATGLGQTTVYWIKRFPVKREAGSCPDTATSP